MGINGKWGSGKTSFLNLVRKHLDKTDVIEIEFNPWNSHTPKAIIEDFFGTMQYELAKHHSGASKQIRSYSKKLLELNDNALTRSIQFSSSTLFGEESLGQLKQDVQKSLEILNKKIVVYIDDLDRLDKNEIIEVLRLIRNTADFKNTIFVVCYDREYILKALEGLNDLSKRYLEKIIQLEITLPFYKPSKLRVELKNRLCDIFPSEYHDIITKSLVNGMGYHETARTEMDKWNLNFRDITLLVNSLSLNSSNLLNEYHFPDLLKLELIRLKFPKAYASIYTNAKNYFEIKVDVNERKYELKKIDGKFAIESDLKTNKSETGLSEIEIILLMGMLKSLFGINRYNSEDPEKLSIVFPSKFYNYFSFGVGEGRLPNYEFRQAFELSIQELKIKIDNWVERGLEFEVVDRLSIINDFDNKEHFEKVINSIFYLANKKSKFIEYNATWGKIVSYPANTLFKHQLYNIENRISKLYHTRKEWIDFIKPFFVNAQPPFYFEANLVSYFNDNINVKDYPEYFIFDQDEASNIMDGYFTKYLKSIDQFDDNIWPLYHLSKKKIWDIKSDRYQKNSPVSIEVKNAFIEFVKNKDIDGFISSIISDHPWTQYKRIQSIVLELFDDWDTFSIFINETTFEKSKSINKFRLFLSEFKEKSFNDYIPFEFNDNPGEKRDH